jgi:membrane protein implicated in regulation of membrane protease activity
MQQNKNEAIGAGVFLLTSIVLNAVVLKQGYISDAAWYAMLLFTLPLLGASIVVFRRRQQ